MTAIRTSTKLVQYEVTLLYTVPAGKFATMSAAFQKPVKAGLFIHTGADLVLFALSSPVAYTPLHPDMGLFTIPGNTSANKFKSSSSTYADITVASTNIGFRYSLGTLSPISSFTELKNTSYYTKSIPILDYQADPSSINGLYYNNGSQWKFGRGYSLEHAYGSWNESYLGLTSQGSSYNAGGAIYGTSAICMDTTGYSSWWFNSIIPSSNGVAPSGNYTSEPSTNSCYYIATATSRAIVPGSPQIMIADGTVYFWCSSWSAGNTPLAARISLGNVQAGNYNSWDTYASTFTGSINGEKLYWCRKVNGYLYVGSSTDSIYSTSGGFNTAYTKITAPNADVDVQMPPIRNSATTLIFRSKAGSGYWVMTGGVTPSWSNVTDVSTLYGYTPNSQLTSLITAAGITPIYSSSTPTGTRGTDLRLYENTTYRDVINGYDTRGNASDLVNNLSRNAERTNLLLTAGDKLYGYSESSNTVMHVYGFEEYQ